MKKLLINYPLELDKKLLAFMKIKNIKSRTQAIITILTEVLK